MSLTIGALTQQMHDAGLTRVDQAKLLGISPLQAHFYRSGKTKRCGVKVAICAYRHITIEGEPVVLSPFLGKQDILDNVQLYEEQSAQRIRDYGFGNYNLTTPSN